ncbi:MAG: hypothetical protein QXL43_01260 [Methanolinea sp.]
MTKAQGTRKKDGNSGWDLRKVGLVVIGVSFAVIMVVSSLGMGWLVSLHSAAAGDRAVVFLTLYDQTGRPVLTGDLRKFNQTHEAGNIVWLCGPIPVTVGETETREIVPVAAYNYVFGESRYGILPAEYNAIAQGIAGMRQGEIRKIPLPGSAGLEREMSAEEYEGYGGNFTRVVPGDQVILGIPYGQDAKGDANEPQSFVVRTGYVTAKTGDGVRVNYAHSHAEVTLRELSKA